MTLKWRLSYGDWEAIEKRLPHPSIQPVHRNWYYWAAAAVAAIAIVSSGLLWYGTQEPQEAFDQKELFVQKKQDNQPAVPQDNETITKEKELLAEVTFERPVPKKAVFSAKRKNLKWPSLKRSPTLRTSQLLTTL